MGVDIEPRFWIGQGTDAPSGDGALGSVQSKLRNIYHAVQTMVGETEQYQKSGPVTMEVGNQGAWALELKGNLAAPTTTEIEPGSYQIDRLRGGALTSIIGSSAASESAGRIYCAYTPTLANWQPGDLLLATFFDGYVRDDTGTAATLSANVAIGGTSITVANAYAFVVGWTIRIYDALTSEYNTVAAIVNATTITVTALSNNYTTTNNAAVVRSIRTDLESAYFYTSIEAGTLTGEEINDSLVSEYDPFNWNDADADTARWDVGYIINLDGSAAGTEGGSASIASNVLTIAVDPDATPTMARYAVYRAAMINSRFFSVMVDLSATFGTANATGTGIGLSVSKGSTMDANNRIEIYRYRTDAVNQFKTSATINSVAQTAYTTTTTDNVVSFKIERSGAIWRCYYSITAYPNYDWTLLAQYEDPSNFLTAETTPFFWAESGGGVDAQTIQGDFDNYMYILNTQYLEDQIGDGLETASGPGVESSVHAKLRGLQAALGITAAGTGTGLEVDGSPSLVTALGTDGTTVTDTAASVLGAIGADNNNNAFASTNVAANVNGSILERLESLQAALGIVAAAAGAGFEVDGVPSLYAATKSLMRVDTIPMLSEFWIDEAGIDSNLWTTTAPATGTLARSVAEAGYVKVGIAPNLNEVGRIRSNQRYKATPGQYGANTIVRTFNIEFEVKLTTVANIDNTISFFGLTPGTGDTRTTNNIIGWALTSDALQSLTDSAGTETVNTTFGETLTNWNKLRIEVYASGIKFYVNEVLKATHTTNIPDQMMYINYYVDTEAGGAATVDVGPVRTWYEDMVI